MPLPKDASGPRHRPQPGQPGLCPASRRDDLGNRQAMQLSPRPISWRCRPDLGAVRSSSNARACCTTWADPLAGWRRADATDPGKPGGLMKVSLYSETGTPVMWSRPARPDRRTKGWQGRRPMISAACRAEILDAPRSKQLFAMVAVASGRDFYSLSLCRDLIFHVQEHRFTICRVSSRPWPDLELGVFLASRGPTRAAGGSSWSVFRRTPAASRSTTGRPSRRPSPTASPKCTSSGSGTRVK